MKTTKETLLLALDYLRSNKFIDQESVFYFQDRYPFTNEELDELLFSLESLFLGDKRSIRLEDPFQECFTYLEYEGQEFIWRWLQGQGTIMQLRKHTNWIPYQPEHKIVLPKDFLD